ncbi:zinc finger [Striga asiatica]|uniref:Zinc finger n=1 Tax=Striga asiatica TaxID=4170 RepID=A0A5A7PXD0_STRAF|nr:zinc finger [Striga asiatica]
MGYSKLVVTLDIIWNLAFVLVSVVMLICSAREKTNVLRVWVFSGSREDDIQREEDVRSGLFGISNVSRSSDHFIPYIATDLDDVVSNEYLAILVMLKSRALPKCTICINAN